MSDIFVEVSHDALEIEGDPPEVEIDGLRYTRQQEGDLVCYVPDGQAEFMEAFSKETCPDCGLSVMSPKFGSLMLDDESWAKIAPEPPEPNGGGRLCPNCILGRLSDRGVYPTHFFFAGGPLGDETGPLLQEGIRKIGIRREEPA